MAGDDDQKQKRHPRPIALTLWHSPDIKSECGSTGAQQSSATPT
jgi:hypothetical protein